MNIEATKICKWCNEEKIVGKFNLMQSGNRSDVCNSCRHKKHYEKKKTVLREVYILKSEREKMGVSR